MGRDPPAPVYDGGRRRDELDRRDLKGLSKGDGGELHKSHIFLLVHDRRCLAGEIDPGLSEKPKLFEIMIERIHAKSRTNVDKHRVTGVHGSL